MTRVLLGKFELDDQLESSIDDTNLLELAFATARSDTSVISDDGNKTVAWLAPSGELAALLVQDYVNGESRSIPFGFGTIEIVNDGTELTVFLSPA